MFRNIDFYCASMKSNTGHNLCGFFSAQLCTVTMEIASNTWLESPRDMRPPELDIEKWPEPLQQTNTYKNIRFEGVCMHVC